MVIADAMQRPIAIVRRPARSLIDCCELTFLERETIALDTIERQHRAYCDALAATGAEVVVLDAIETLPDSVFVEDAAVVLEELALMTRPGSVARRPEPASLEHVLASYRRIESIVAPGTLEGGDVLRIGRTLYVGLTTRTNREGIVQLTQIAQPLGYQVIAVPVTGCLHLKTACTALDSHTLLANPAWIDLAPFAGFEIMTVADNESFAANVLSIGDARIVNTAFPHTCERVLTHTACAGLRAITVDISEFGKAEAGLTCMSLVFSDMGRSA